MDVFEEYFRRADLDRDGKISGAEAVAFSQGSSLPKPVLAQVWMYADQNRTGFLGRQEFSNFLKLVTVAQSGRQLTPEIVKSALYGPAAAKIPPPKINPVSTPTPQLSSATMSAVQTSSSALPSSQFGALAAKPPQSPGFRPIQGPQNAVMNQQLSSTNNNIMRPPQSTLAGTSPPVQGGNIGLTGGPGGSVAGPHLPISSNSSLSTDWLGGKSSGVPVGGMHQAPFRATVASQNLDRYSLGLSEMTRAPPQRQSTQQPSIVPKPLDPVITSSKSNESKALVPANDPFFGGDVFSTNFQPNADANKSSFSSNNNSLSSTSSSGTGIQNAVRYAQVDTNQNHSLSTVGNQLSWTQSNVKQNQVDNLKISTALAVPTVVDGHTNSASNQSQIQWPKITQADIKKYTNVFVNVDKDRDGKITGEQARTLFLSWKLPREVLKQVWDLSDQDNDSMLSLREFCIALYLMERYREGRSLPSVLPSTIMYDETLLRATGMPTTAYGAPTWQPGFSQQGLSQSQRVMPTTGVRPPIQTPLPQQGQAVGAAHTVQQNFGKPGLNNHVINNLRKDENISPNSKYQGSTNADDKVQEAENQILDSKEKIEFYRTKMQELVLYKSRCDNRLNEITERASADRREVELLAKKYEEKYKHVGELASKLAIEEAKYRDIQERKMELHNAIIKMEQGGSADGLLQVRVDRIQSDLEGLEKALNERCKQHGVPVKVTTSVELPFGWESGPLEGAADWDEDWDKFEDEGFTVTKDLTSGHVGTASAEEPKSPPMWRGDVSTDEISPFASSLDVDGNNEKLYGEHEHINGSAYDYSEEGSTRSPTSRLSSPGRSTMESPFNSMQSGIHDTSPRTKIIHSNQVGAESKISGDNYTDEPWTFDDTDSVWKDTDYNENTQNNFFMSDFGSIKADSPSSNSVFETEKRSPFFEDSVPCSPSFNYASSRFNDGRDEFGFDSFSRFDSFVTHDSGAFPARESLSPFDSISSSRPETLTRFDSVSSSREFGHTRGFESFDDADPFGSTGPFRSSGSQSPRRGF
ncbi:epidermal growth factor receptor substrate 15-like isoform X1 [Canna indica]|uniref:Epidermal growth factor receptor substrate 15-like isoform X1 n=1 Tax=Canna indica TaxID=4628 RepID=A0AAQ3KY07_9LILI|nr:epidermal growth factor receptor substrate 15-like isoform X1 [Canna indica]